MAHDGQGSRGGDGGSEGKGAGTGGPLGSGSDEGLLTSDGACFLRFFFSGGSSGGMGSWQGRGQTWGQPGSGRSQVKTHFGQGGK